MKSALAQLVEPFMPTEGVPKRKEYLNSYEFITISSMTQRTSTQFANWAYVNVSFTKQINHQKNTGLTVRIFLTPRIIWLLHEGENFTAEKWEPKAKRFLRYLTPLAGQA